MKNNIRLINLTTALVLALVFGALLPSAAFADGETPPPPDSGTIEITDASATADATSVTDEATPTPEASVTEEIAPTEEPTVTEAAPTEAAPEAATEEATIVDVATEEVPVDLMTEETTTADLLASLPEGTELVVVDADGETVPLASEEAAEIMVAGDPIWCPSGVAPTPGVAPCTISYPDLDSLVINFIPTGNGTIWFDDGSVGAGVTIDGFFNWAAARTYNLTLQGGWGGTPGSTALDPTDPYTYFDGANDDFIRIINWIGSVTLKNLVFNSASTAGGVTNYQTLDIRTAGNIVLDKVQVNDASNTDDGVAGGALLMVYSDSPGSITITNSSFSNNEGYGLYANSNGTITLKNVFAYNNGANGATIETIWGLRVKPITISSSEFSGNGDNGLVALSTGIVTLNNVTATNNSEDGVHIVNTPIGAYPVYVNGVNNFSSNVDDGLYVESKGTITLSKTTANNNGGDGAYLDNSGAAGYQPVTIAGFFTGIGNDGDGLDILSRGNVTVAYMTANDNGSSGVNVDNGTSSDLPKPVLIAGKNIFNNNGSHGLYVESKGAITVYNLTATYNGLASLQLGVQLDNKSANPAFQQPVTLYGVNLFTNNGGRGLSIASYGAVTVNSITALYNGLSGVNIVNFGGLYPKAVTVKGTNIFNNNGVHGLYVLSDGAITAANVSASKNRNLGAYLDNDNSATAQFPVSITGFGVFEYNGKLNGEHEGAPGGSQFGLEIRSHGHITLTNISANHNYGSGAYILTHGITTVHSVTLNGINTFNSNGDSNGESGLFVEADGAIKVSKLTATGNLFGFGAWLDNRAVATSQQPVTVSGYSLVTDNLLDGLSIVSYGAVTLSNVTSLYNQIGLNINNNGGTYPKALLINGTNTFNNNRSYGLVVFSISGPITVSNITASKNKDAGAVLRNDNSAAAQSNVTISGYEVFEYNGKLDGQHDGAAGINQYGLLIYSDGSITLTNISANHNYGSGVRIITIGITTVHPVTFYGTNTFNNNGDSGQDSGLVVESDGAITVYKLTAMDNFFYGASLKNHHNSANQQPVTVSGYSMLTNNGLDGMHIWSYGTVTLSNLTAINNQTGLYLDNTAGNYPKAVLINGTNTFSNNRDYGVKILSDGAITISNITASRNKEGGVYMDNDNSSSAQSNVTISGYGLFEWNGYNGGYGVVQVGLQTKSHGVVTLANISANQNYGTGVDISTSGITTPKAVTLTGNNSFTFNGDDGFDSGLKIVADGKVNINNLSASYNYFHGVDIDNTDAANFPAITAGGVTVTGFGFAIGNLHGTGLAINTLGAITLNRIVADNNGDGDDAGMYLNATGSITLVCSSAFGNSWWNLYAHTLGTLTLKGLMSFGGGTSDDLNYATLVTGTCS
jgi:hypothetical protein